jgi:AcrR family transcriptional regulator
MTTVQPDETATVGAAAGADVDSRPGPPPVRDQRARILDEALRLWSDGGVHATSMRALAAACDLNVATLYHYFPSKSALLDELIEAQNYRGLLAELPPIDLDLPPRPRLEALLEWVWSNMADNDHIWKLLLGESLRGDAQAMASAALLSRTFEEGLAGWLDRAFADVATDHRTLAPVLRATIYGCVVEVMTIPPEDRPAVLHERAQQVAAGFLP